MLSKGRFLSNLQESLQKALDNVVLFYRFEPEAEISCWWSLLELILPTIGHELVELVWAAKWFHCSVAILKKSVNSVRLNVAIGLSGQRE